MHISALRSPFKGGGLLYYSLWCTKIKKLSRAALSKNFSCTLHIYFCMCFWCLLCTHFTTLFFCENYFSHHSRTQQHKSHSVHSVCIYYSSAYTQALYVVCLCAYYVLLTQHVVYCLCGIYTLYRGLFITDF